MGVGRRYALDYVTCNATSKMIHLLARRCATQMTRNDESMWILDRLLCDAMAAARLCRCGGAVCLTESSVEISQRTRIFSKL